MLAYQEDTLVLSYAIIISPPVCAHNCQLIRSGSNLARKEGYILFDHGTFLGVRCTRTDRNVDCENIWGRGT